MSRFLFVVPPFVGHVNPASGVADELRTRGHRVSWVGDPAVLDGRVGAAHVYAGPSPELPARPPGLRGFGALAFLWQEVLIPLAEAMVPVVEQAVAEERPDVLVVDQQALAGSLVAERLNIPWATSATTSSEFSDPLALVPNVRRWVWEQLTELRKRFGDPANDDDPRYSPLLVLAFTTPMLAGEAGLAGSAVRFVGPVRRREGSAARLPWDRLGGRPLVYASLGTTNGDAGARFLRECVAALGARPDLTGIVADPEGVIDGAPANVYVAGNVRQLEVMERASAVICHAGHNTVCEALAAAVPLVVAPIRDDQPIVAEQVVRAGAGIRLRFARAASSHIGAALDSVLTDPKYRQAALRVRDSFDAAGGAATAADHLESLAVR